MIRFVFAMSMFIVLIPVTGINQTIKHGAGKSKRAANKAANQRVKAIDSAESELCFPLQEDDVYNLYSYIIDLQDPMVIRRYSGLFKKYGYVFSGYVWEGILKEIINTSEDNELVENVFLKSQSGMVGFTFTKHDVAKKLPAVLCPVLGDTKAFEKFIEGADRRRIKNY